MENERYLTTRDFGETCVQVASGNTPIAIQTQGNIVYFKFLNTDQVRQTSEQFFLGVLNVNARKLLAAQSQCRDLIKRALNDGRPKKDERTPAYAH